MAKKKIEMNPEVLEARLRMENLLVRRNEKIKEKEEFNALCDAQDAERAQKRSEKNMSLDAEIAYIDGQIRGYHSLAEPKETTTFSKVELISGTVKVKKPKGDYDKDLDKLLGWARTKGREDLIERKETYRFKWAEFKTTLSIQADSVIDKETGEVLLIDGLGVIEKPEELVIE